MDETLYLTPPTIIEEMYAIAGKKHPPESAYNIILNMTSNIEKAKEPFPFPDELLQEKYKTLEELLSQIEYSEEYHPKKIDESEARMNFFITKKRFLENLYNYLLPETTWKRKKTECKGFAVFAIAYNRKKGIPSRFIPHGKNHVRYEELKNGYWFIREPQEPQIIIPDIKINEEYDYFYEKILKKISKSKLF